MEVQLEEKGVLESRGLVWVKHPKLAWAPATILRRENEDFVARVEDGLEVRITREHAEMHSVHKSSLSGIPNLLVLGDYCEGALLHNVRTRYYQDNIYTCIGNLILISINPYKVIPELYGRNQFNLYRNGLESIGSTSSGKKANQNNNDQSSGLPPHIFKTAQNAYDSLFKEKKSQSIIITGESGAGKTEATKIILCYLANIQRSTSSCDFAGGRPISIPSPSIYSRTQSPVSSLSPKKDDSSIESLVLRSNPILEAFGNAKTIRNDNSSRFGKFIEIYFDATGKLRGASISNYLLEKCRLTNQQEGERNYHIFYCLAAGLSKGIFPEAFLKELNIHSQEDFSIIRESIDIPGRDDSIEMKEVLECLKCIGICESEIFEIMRVCAGILHLCNFDFIQESAGVPPNVYRDQMGAFDFASKLLKLDPNELLNVFQWKKLKDPETGRIIRMPVSLEAAFQTRDSMAKAIYSKLFDWLVFRINKSMTNGLINNGVVGTGQDHLSKKLFSGRSIGLLDIYGFEVFDCNSFEQFCINFSNEKLQQQFNHQMFQEEQQVYEGEGIDWTRIDFIDNKVIIDSLEKKPNGIFPLLDSECLMPQGSDSSFLNKILKLSGDSNKTHNDNQVIYKPSKMSNSSFAVSHYAGPVIYDTRGFLEKNRDQLHSDVTELLRSSESCLITELFDSKPSCDSQAKRSSISRSGTGIKLGEDISSNINTNTVNRPKGILITVSGAFRDQLNGLIETLNSTSPSYIRCIKPNSRKAVHEFDSLDVLRQLRCAGMLESIRIRRSGYSVRRKFKDFYNRYKILYPSFESHDFTGAKNYSLICKNILEKLQSELQEGQDETERRKWDNSWQIGKTQVFVKDSLQTQLERCVSEACNKYCTSISAAWRMYRAKKEYKKIKKASVNIQSSWRSFQIRKSFLEILGSRIKAAKIIQKAYRDHMKIKKQIIQEEVSNAQEFDVVPKNIENDQKVSKFKVKTENNETQDHGQNLSTNTVPTNVSRLWEILDSLQTNNDKTRQDLEQNKEVVERKDEEIANSKIEIGSLKDKITLYEGQISSLESKIKLMESEHQRIISDLEYKMEISKISMETETNKISESYESQKSDLNSKILVLEQKMEIEKNRVLYLERLLEQSDKDLSALRNQFSAEIEDRQHERDYCMKETERYRETQVKLQNQLSMLEQSRSAALKSVEDLNKFKTRVQELEKENSGLRQELNEKNDKISQLETINQQLKSSKHLRSQKLDHNYSNIVSKSDISTSEDAFSLSGSLTPNYYHIHPSSQKSSASSLRLAELEGQYSELADINNQLRENVEILEDDKATLQKRILELFVERRTLMDENKSLNVRVRQKSTQVDALKSTLTELRNTAENSLNEIRSEWESCVQRLEATQYALMESSKELEVVRSERDELLACLDDVQHFTEATMKRRQRSLTSCITANDPSLIAADSSEISSYIPYDNNVDSSNNLNVINSHSPIVNSFRRKHNKGSEN
ncbi:myosin-related protein [Cryptosporidium ubiquitum]|uniref:Myosin-related protein n=1 Tax=Cryptosporidium ubiquitum TaxID=857276 RepID=A0A1J4MGK2_9CRYT|nr:myosin-related protein [Cryptosporidium ubiquitum]OII73353.1 myosin-related protein [Cryptosporidium ubiquitum]